MKAIEGDPWPKVTLEEVQARRKWALNGGPFGSKLVRRDYVDSGVPVIRGLNVSGDAKFNAREFVYVSEEKADELLPNNAHPGDVIFTQRGTLGQVGLIPKNSPHRRFVVSQSQMKLTVNQSKADPNYIYYYFRRPETIQELNNRAFSSGVPHINLAILREFSILLPPLTIQRRIAAVLSGYDDLIENNLRRIKTLEEMAQNLYVEWFISFRFSGHEGVKMVGSQIGDVPEGWKAASIMEIPQLRFVRENVKPYHGKKRYFATGDIDGLKIVKEGIEYSYSDKPSRAQKQPVPKSVWFARMKDTYKVLAFTPTSKPNAEDSILSSGFAGFEALSEEWFNYLFFTIDSKEFHERKSLYCTGATQMSITNEGLTRIQVVVPDEEVIRKFAAFSGPIIDQMLTLLKQNGTLGRTRDILLPRLVSGELDVSRLDIHTEVMDT